MYIKIRVPLLFDHFKCFFIVNKSTGYFFCIYLWMENLEYYKSDSDFGCVCFTVATQLFDGLLNYLAWKSKPKRG